MRTGIGSTPEIEAKRREKIRNFVLRQDPASRAKRIRASAEGIRRKFKEDPEFRARSAEATRESLKRLRQDKAFVDASREAAKRKWNDPEFRKKMAEAHRRQWEDKEFVAKIKAANLERRSRLNWSKENLPEKMLREALTSMGFVVQIGKKIELAGRSWTVPDAYVSELDLAIYTDGTYWHGRPEVKRRDVRVDADLLDLGHLSFRFDQGKDFDAEMRRFAAFVREI
jgi:hypothetical protein